MTRRFQCALVLLISGLRLRLDPDSFSSINPNDDRVQEYFKPHNLSTFYSFFLVILTRLCARTHGCGTCRNVFWKENSNANMENIAGKLKKLNSMSNVIRLDFWDFVAVEAECCMLSIMKGSLHLRFVF